MSGLREALVEALHEHEYADGGPADECRCGAKLDTLSARALHWHQADAVLRVLAEHGDIQQVREQIRDAIRRVATPIGGDPAKTPVWEPLFDAVMAVVAPIVAARDSAVERGEEAEAERDAAVKSRDAWLWLSNAAAEHGDTQQVRERLLDAVVDHRARGIACASGVQVVADDVIDDAVMPVVAEILAARDAAAERRTDLVVEYRKREETQDRIRVRLEAELAAARQRLDQVQKWAEHPLRADSLRELLAILNAPARPAGHDETGQ